MTAFRSWWLAALVMTGLASALRAEDRVQVERTWLPYQAGPSSFAVGLPGGIGFCYDPVRCALSYVWTGGFVDLTSVRPGMGKLVKPVTLAGPLVYRETGAAPLRHRDAAHPGVVEFKGYTLRDDGIEFRYLLNGSLVREEIRTGAAGTLTRRYHVTGAAAGEWFYAVDGEAPVTLLVDEDGVIANDITLGAPLRLNAEPNRK